MEQIKKYNDAEEMCESNKGEHHEGKIKGNQYNRSCTRYYL
jgi:hypothetical protein